MGFGWLPVALGRPRASRGHSLRRPLAGPTRGPRLPLPLPAAEQVRRCENGHRGAVEAAALIFPAQPEIPANRILARLCHLKVQGFRLDRIVAEIRNAAGESGRALEAVAVMSLFPDAPVPDGPVLPAGWAVSASGVARLDADDLVPAAPSIFSPVLVAGRLIDLGEGVESLRLVWADAARWREATVSRGQVLDRRRVVELAAFGAPCTSNNASDFVQFIAEFEHANLEALPQAVGSRQMGWQAAMGAFLWGSCDLAGGDGSGVAFRAADVGEEQAASAFRSAGDVAGWREAVAVLNNLPRVKLGLCAAVSAPLLGVVGAANFAVEYCGPTSVGKTAALRVAASVWGSPGDQEPTLVASWNSSRAWAERASSAANGLPIFLDDSRQAADPDEASRLVYDLTNGRGRGRGSILGTQRTLTFQTVLISTGEAPLASFTRSGGTRARILSLWGHPFGASSPEAGGRVMSLTQSLLAHHGHAGPGLVRFLLANRERWEAWRVDHGRLRLEYGRRAGTHPVGTRLAGHLTTISLAARLSTEAGLLPWQRPDPVDELWDELLGESSGADQAAEVLAHAVDWASAHATRFLGTSPSGQIDEPA